MRVVVIVVALVICFEDRCRRCRDRRRCRCCVVVVLCRHRRDRRCRRRCLLSGVASRAAGLARLVGLWEGPKTAQIGPRSARGQKSQISLRDLNDLHKGFGGLPNRPFWPPLD